MNITIPVYIETTSAAPGKAPEYVVRPLFFPSPEARSPFLQSALNKLTQRLREIMVEAGKLQRHESLAAWTFNPETETRRCEVRIEVAKQSARLKLLIVLIRQFERRIAFTPTLPDVWFDVLPDQDPEDRLAESITEFLKKVSRDSADGMPTDLDRYSLKGNAWVSEIEFRINPPRVRKAPEEFLFAFLGSAETVDGESELYKVGRCLNHQYPQDLDRVILRDQEVADLSKLLKADDRRPILLLGQRQAGKTAILHEYVFRHVQETGNPHRDKQAIWLLSPQRLISGMSYVGQWESRFHAIVKHAALRDLVLYFDDLLGLFQAGVTSQSTLNVAALLKVVLERREIRVIAEITPEGFRVLREKDRKLADAFHVIRVDELSGDDNLRVLLGLQRQLEVRHRCRFAIDALPAVIDLQRRYARDISFPGKAAAFLKRLAVRVEGESDSSEHPTHGHSDNSAQRGQQTTERPVVSRDRILDVFHQQSGLPRSFLDQQQTLSAEDIRARLRERFVGQPDAVQAAVEILGIAKARLNDPTRPIASLLLLGPTGVGKTEFAKSLAGYLFGNSDRLLRFDMNEYVSPSALPQLVGTFAQPEGLLTAAVRRQPFAVVLFDEIEKGHPDVFDLLLQVLGEGRLTDARGRTTDFSNTMIVLTSNLGTQRSETGLGFGTTSIRESSASIRAAENFFRPEFFNRLDRVIPFDRLSREDMQEIARHLMSDVLRRDGLVRRQCVLNTTPAAVDWVINQGYNPVLGARALKRAIERELTRPIARFLAERADSLLNDELTGLMLIDIDRAEHGLSVTVRALRNPPDATLLRTTTDGPIHSALERCHSIIGNLSRCLPELKSGGQFEAGRLSPEQTRYLLVQDELPRLKTWLEELQLAQRVSSSTGSSGVISKPAKTGSAASRTIRGKGPSHGNVLNRAAADDEIDDFFENRFESPPRDVDLAEETPGLLARCCWVRTVAAAEIAQLDETVTLRVDSLDPTRTQHAALYAQRLAETWTDELALETSIDPGPAGQHSHIVRLRGVLATQYAAAECGFHAITGSNSHCPMLICVQVINQPISEILVRRVQSHEANVAQTFPSADELRQRAWERFV